MDESAEPYDPHPKISLEGVPSCLPVSPRLQDSADEYQIRLEMEENARQELKRSVDPKHR